MSNEMLGLDEEQWFFIILFILIIVYLGNIKANNMAVSFWPLIILVLYGVKRGFFSLKPRDEVILGEKEENNEVEGMDNKVTQNETVPEWENTQVGVDDLLKYKETENIKPLHMGEVDIDFYLEGKPIQEIHEKMGSLGDNRLANRMKYSSVQAKETHDSWARMNSEKMRRVFEEELQEQENRDWWDAEQDYLDELM